MPPSANCASPACARSNASANDGPPPQQPPPPSTKTRRFFSSASSFCWPITSRILASAVSVMVRFGVVADVDMLRSFGSEGGGREPAGEYDPPPRWEPESCARRGMAAPYDPARSGRLSRRGARWRPGRAGKVGDEVPSRGRAGVRRRRRSGVVPPRHARRAREEEGREAALQVRRQEAEVQREGVAHRQLLDADAWVRPRGRVALRLRTEDEDRHADAGRR